MRHHRPPGETQRVAARVLPPRAPLLVKALTEVLRGHQQKALCVQSGRGASLLFSSPKRSKSLCDKRLRVDLDVS